MNKKFGPDRLCMLETRSDDPEETPALIQEGCCNARIDLTLPIAPQIKRIKEQAEKEQKYFKEQIKNKKFKYEVIVTAKKSKPTNKNLWKTYIRCLDATMQGIKRKDAANTFFTATSTQKTNQTPEQKWDEAIKQAKAMVRSGYGTLRGQG